jgi:hypothetical protein
VIAEEDSDEALATRGKVSIAKQLADDRGIPHKFCDPTEQQRRDIGYRDGQSLELEIFMADTTGLSHDDIFRKARAIEICRYFPIRERFWLEQMNPAPNTAVVFICGDLHIESFGKILEAAGYPHRVFVRGIGLTAEDARFDEALRYLREHPEVLIE